MIIDQLEIEGFKSYKEKTILKNFGDHFNAITGNNGCGKSNILDSICFVLGISNLNIIRASRIEDLIYQDENLKLNSAKVTLMLKDSEIQKFGDKVLRNKKSISISRTIFISGKNRYSLGGIRVAPGKILNFLYSVNLNITYPHFIIHQGHISKVSLIDGNSIPTPFPLGYLNADGRSFILTEVLIILTSSASSLAAITTKFGNVDK